MSGSGSFAGTFGERWGVWLKLPGLPAELAGGFEQPVVLVSVGPLAPVGPLLAGQIQDSAQSTGCSLPG